MMSQVLLRMQSLQERIDLHIHAKHVYRFQILCVLFSDKFRKHVTVLSPRVLLNAPLSGEHEASSTRVHSPIPAEKSIFRCSFCETSRRRVTIQMPSERTSRIFRLVSVFQSAEGNHFRT